MKKIKLLTNTYDLNDLIDEFRDNPSSPLFKILKFTKNDYVDLYYETVALGYSNPFPKSSYTRPFMIEIPYPLVRVDKQYCNLMGIDAPDLDYDQMLYNPTNHKFIQYSNRFGTIITTEIKGSFFETGEIVTKARYRSYIRYYKNLIKQIKFEGKITGSMKESITHIKSKIRLYKNLVKGKTEKLKTAEQPYKTEQEIADSL